MAKWESSKADLKIDRAGEKRTGKSHKEWEGSKEDKKADAKGKAKLKMKGKK